jgi:hypothetical protein
MSKVIYPPHNNGSIFIIIFRICGICECGKIGGDSEQNNDK